MSRTHLVDTFTPATPPLCGTILVHGLRVTDDPTRTTCLTCLDLAVKRAENALTVLQFRSRSIANSLDRKEEELLALRALQIELTKETP